MAYCCIQKGSRSVTGIAAGKIHSKITARDAEIVE